MAKAKEFHTGDVFRWRDNVIVRTGTDKWNATYDDEEDVENLWWYDSDVRRWRRDKIASPLISNGEVLPCDWS